MNCRRVQNLLPLHVEGDLDAAAASRVQSHLEWCGRCNWLADEYKESQTWLHASQPPEFDETFLEGLKLGVMNSIAESKARPSLLASLAHHWNRRQILVLAASFLVVLGMVVLYLYQARAQSNPVLISDGLQQPTTDDPKPPDNVPLLVPVAEGAPGASSGNRHTAPKDTHNGRSSPGHSAVLAQTVKHNVMTQTRVTSETSNVARDQTDSQSGITNRSRDMLRIEIQTGDPSIRIIWFAPKETDLHQSKPATD